LDGFEQVVRQQQVQHRGFVHDEEIQIQRVFVVVLEAFHWGKLKQTNDGPCRVPGRF
jgi:hypothetical protein